MLPSGLAMLWEDGDPLMALQRRFGFEGIAAVDRWSAATLRATWGIDGASLERLVISDTNAIGWVRADERVVVVKIAAAQRGFARLHAVAELAARAAASGVRTPAPCVAVDGAARTVVDGGARPLSVLVLPCVAGTHLDVADLGAVRRTGVELARFHEVLAGISPDGALAPLTVPWRGAEIALRTRLLGWAERAGPAAPAAAMRRVVALVDALPDLVTQAQLVHGDVRAANVLVESGEVTALLDLDEVGLDHRVADLGRAAVLLATLYRDWGPTPAGARAALIAGYRSVVELSDVELGWLDAVVLATAISMVPDGDDRMGWGRSLEQLLETG